VLIVESYPLAVALCAVTMLGWGSWANARKLASREWRFQLSYWDHAIGVLLLALLAAFTAGSKNTRTGTGWLLALLFASFVIGLALIATRESPEARP
jgi:glucose uptake protein